jgi:hypothetical protein
MGNNIENLVKEFGFDRKPATFNEVTDTVQGEVNTLVDEILSGLPRYNYSQLGIKNPLDYFKESFRDKLPMLFILEIKGNEYLINTEGFNYCRTVLFIKNTLKEYEI